jgi:hypothetical protein
MSPAFSQRGISGRRALLTGRLRGPDFFTIRRAQHDRPDLIRLHVERVLAHADLYNDREAKPCDPDHAVELGTGHWLDAAPHVLGC